VTSTSLTPPAWPIDAAEDKPQAAAGLTYAANLAGRDDVESWSILSAEWCDGSNGAPDGVDLWACLVWWREKPQPSDAIAEAAQWIRAMCHSAQESEAVRLSARVVEHGGELADALDAIAEQDET
jgi:hypothetical protein